MVIVPPAPQIIEFVCTGNKGRSPVAELIGRNYLRENRLIGRYGAASSGTSVDAIKREELDGAFMRRIVALAHRRGDVYHGSNARQVGELLGKDGSDPRDEQALQLFYGRAAAAFAREETQYRARVLPALGIEGTCKEEQDQTVPREDVIAVFSMADSNQQAVSRIYAQSSLSKLPTIAVVSAYAHDDLTREVPNAFGGDEAAYRAGIETLLQDVPKAIERLLR